MNTGRLRVIFTSSIIALMSVTSVYAQDEKVDVDFDSDKVECIKYKQMTQNENIKLDIDEIVKMFPKGKDKIITVEKKLIEETELKEKKEEHKRRKEEKKKKEEEERKKQKNREQNQKDKNVKNKKSNKEIAQLVVDGKYGNGEQRKQRIAEEGYNYSEIQKEVKILTSTQKTNNETNNEKANSINKSNSKQSKPKQTKESSGNTKTMEATAYSLHEPGLGNFTANGTDLRKNSDVIAVDPNVIPLGTKVTIEGYGTYTAADTGGAIKGNRIDIHVNSVNEANQFGRRSVKVTIHN